MRQMGMSSCRGGVKGETGGTRNLGKEEVKGETSGTRVPQRR